MERKKYKVTVVLADGRHRQFIKYADSPQHAEIKVHRALERAGESSVTSVSAEET